MKEKNAHVSSLNTHNSAGEALQLATRQVSNLTILDVKKIESGTNGVLDSHVVFLVENLLYRSLQDTS